MFPVLFTIGKIPISSFGVLMALGFFVSVFLIWRLTRAWDLDEEKVLDLTILTFLGGLIGARFYFAFSNLDLFSENILDIFFFNKIPGFNFVGALIGGFASLYFFSKKKKMDFWMSADIASIGLITGLIFVSLGCFLGGCNVGAPSDLFFAVDMVGEVGRRLPIQLLEAFLLTLTLLKLWSASIHFHQRGKILSFSLIYIGVINILTAPFKDSYDGLLFSTALTIIGIFVFYKISKRRLEADIKSSLYYIKSLIFSSEVRKDALSKFSKYWYNQKTSFSWTLRNMKKGLKKLNVRFSFKNN
ncbi:hypothetical protein A3C59_03420 [Candidatus Daviesbacteria bacterium RIFCSPHIGHO2_02_FULL_36_13]|uniref:Prolipoprotein diacylglyceryl transferase n=1 Tax=Candidatus Daviesbacteria bacterium RIFCSPHIGHO2_02_FULL_36_13 TaxID=1797768 RepID=A0A1F5JQ75_9BACT|nr:MAG: hypothetical protein A3C59_03420 [Candidatus Daviesbacteria bacterium RIFCSPHIGHO2_02_FULL_36_13]